MDYLLAGRTLRLSYYRDRRDIDALDEDLLIAQFLDVITPGECLPWLYELPLTNHDHIVLAHDEAAGHPIGLICAGNILAGDRPVLLVRTAFVGAAWRGQGLLARMLAFLLLRIDGLGQMPDAVAAWTTHPGVAGSMMRLAACTPGARFAPDPDAPVVRLNTASLCHQAAAAVGRRFSFAQSAAALQALCRLPRGVTPRFDQEPIQVLIDLSAADGDAVASGLRRQFLPRQAPPLRRRIPA